jgi:hypothetical protein
LTCEEAEKRYEHRILEVCEDLHAFATQGDPYGLPLHEVLELQTWLEDRLSTWAWAKERSAYDRLIYRLIEVTLVEVEKRFKDLIGVPLMAGYCDECGGQDCSAIDCELCRRAIFLWDEAAAAIGAEGP